MSQRAGFGIHAGAVVLVADEGHSTLEVPAAERARSFAVDAEERLIAFDLAAAERAARCFFIELREAEVFDRRRAAAEGKICLYSTS